MEESNPKGFTIKVMVEVSTQSVKLEWHGSLIVSNPNATTTEPDSSRQPEKTEQPDKPEKLDFSDLPEKLSSQAACNLWRKLHAAGYVDSHCRPTLSRTQSAIMAKAMANKLGIKRFWNMFSELWQAPILKSAYGKRLDMKDYFEFEKTINSIIN